MKTGLALTLVVTLLFSAVVGVVSVNLAKADPINEDIIVSSPQEGTIYNSTEVPLRFSLLPMPDINWSEDDIYGHNYTSFSYSVDGHEFVETNGSTTLSGLSGGSHILEIYGVMPFANGSTWYNSSIHPAIHFDVFYHTPPPEAFPTTLVIAGSAIAIAAVAGAGIAVYFKKHKR